MIVRAAIRARLFEQREPVAQAAFGGASHHGDRARLRGQIFLRANFFQRLGNFGERKRAKMKMLRARTDRIGQIFRLGRGHHENDFVGRLLERFQQRVRGFIGKHVRFVEDHDFVASAGGRVAHHLAQFADLVDAAVGGRVDFNHVEGISEADLAAGVALVAGFRGGALRAVERFGENARRGCFAHAARARKNVGMRHAAGLDGVGERARDVLLPDHVGKRLRPPFSRDDLVAHSVRVPPSLCDSALRSENQKLNTENTEDHKVPQKRITEHY